MALSNESGNSFFPSTTVRQLQQFVFRQLISWMIAKCLAQSKYSIDRRMNGPNSESDSSRFASYWANTSDSRPTGISMRRGKSGRTNGSRIGAVFLVSFSRGEELSRPFDPPLATCFFRSAYESSCMGLGCGLGGPRMARTANPSKMPIGINIIRE